MHSHVIHDRGIRVKIIKKQLRKFYSDAGVGIRRAEKLVKADIGAARRYIRAQQTGVCGNVPLDCAFIWQDTAEGVAYWNRRHRGFQ